MKKVAITGNIGSGKSWVCELFKQHLGIPVYNSDFAAKQMYFLPDVRKKLVGRFGDLIYLSDTEIRHTSCSSRHWCMRSVWKSSLMP